MDEQERLEQMDKEWKEQLTKDSDETVAKTDKNRKKRQRQKDAKQRKKNLELSGVAAAVVAAASANEEKKEEQEDNNNRGGEEFTYQPAAIEGGKMDTSTNNKDDTDSELDVKLPAIPNDGSFLEIMKKQLAQADSTEDPKSSNNDPEGGAEPPKKRQAT